MLLVENGCKRYRKFIRQLNKLDEEDQLTVINYLVFSYTENVFLNPSTHKMLKKNTNFMKVCRKTIIAESPIGIPNPLEQATVDFGVPPKFEIPDLLSREYALNLLPEEPSKT